MNRLRAFTPLASLWAAVLLAYSNVYQNAFLYDDEFLIQGNQYIRSWDGLWKSFLTSSTGGWGGRDSFYRPMQGVLYTFVYQIFGLSTVGFHLLNVLLHGLAATFIYLLAQKLGFTKRAGWIAALLWCVHPVHVEAVTYQSATCDSLYALLVLIGLYVATPEFELRAMWKTCIVFLFALFTKESAIVLPLLVMACLYWHEPEERWKPRTYVVTWPLWVIAAVYMLARKTILNFDNTFQFYKNPNIYSENILYRTYTFFATLPHYLRLLIWPTDLHMDRAFSVYINFLLPATVIGFLFLVIAALVVWRERFFKWPVFGFAILWFASAHLPHAGVLIPVNSIFLEHWLYLPTIGLFFWIGDKLSRVSRQHIVSALVVVVSIVLGFLTFKQNEVWATPVSFYTNTIHYESKVARVHNNLAMALSDSGKLEEAIAEYRKGIEISDEYPQTHHNLGLALINTGKIDEGIVELQKALQMNPDFYQSAGLLAEVYQKLGNQEKAQYYQQKFKEIRARFP